MSLLRTITAAILALVATGAITPSSAAPRVPDRPLVFIPGILGSELWIDGTRAWGGAGDLLGLERLKIPAGAKDSGAAPTCDPGRPRVNGCGLLRTFQILGPIKAGEYSGVMQRLEEIGYQDSGPSQNLFVFTYDWRRSNFETADALKAFVDGTPGLAGRDFDVLAHSMGGLVALIYAHRFDAPATGEDCTKAGRCRIKTVITAGTPYFGSMDAVAMPLEGWGWVSRRLAGGADVIARTVLSWPSFYELLPTYDDCCGTDPKATMADASTFARLPYAHGPAAPAQPALTTALHRLDDLRALARAGWPKHIADKTPQCQDGVPRSRLFLVVGDHNDTKRKVALSAGGLSYDVRRGDGTVLLRSAALNDPSQAWLSFATHRLILDDENVKAKLEHILLRCELDTTDFAGSAPLMSLSSTAGVPVESALESGSAHIMPTLGAGAPTFALEASVSVALLSDVSPPTATLVAKVNGIEFLRTTLAEPEVRDEGQNRRYTYGLRDIAVPRPGLVQVSVSFPGGVTVTDENVSY